MKVTVGVPAPPVTEFELSEHVPGGVAAGVTAHVRFTVPAKPFSGAMVIVDVAVPPAATEAGENAEAATVKSGTGTPVTVRVTITL